MPSSARIILPVPITVLRLSNRQRMAGWRAAEDYFRADARRAMTADVRRVVNPQRAPYAALQLAAILAPARKYGRHRAQMMRNDGCCGRDFETFFLELP